MQPLIYLTVRSFVNGIRRALTSPKRLIGLIGVTLYYFWIVTGRFAGGNSSGAFPTSQGYFLTMPPLGAIDSVIFWLFAVISIFLMAGVGQRSTFRPADVDVLFPTPVDPKLVLVFRLLRDYLVTLLMPLLIAVFAFRPASVPVMSFIRNFPKQGGLVFRVAPVAWLLMALCWVCIQYAVELSIHRSDLTSDRNKKVLTWTFGSVLLVLVASFVLQLPGVHDVDSFIRLSHQPQFRIAFFAATLATQIVMAPLEGSWIGSFVGAFALVGLSALAVRVAMTQVGTMYDQAAAKGFGTSQRMALQRKGDMIGIYAEQARSGKIKGRRRWYSNLTVVGPGAIIWKEMLVQSRSTSRMLWLFVPMLVVVVAMPMLMPSRGEISGYMFLFIEGFLVFTLTSSTAQMGFIDLLRRVDVEKPLPFSPTVLVFSEIAAKAIYAILLCLVSCVAVLFFAPNLWPMVVASAIAMPTLAILFCSAVFLVTVLFPDVDDPTQRGFRSMMTLLGLVLLCLPGIGLFIAFQLFLNPAFASIVWAAANLGISLGVAIVGGNLYAQFNPSE